VLNESKEDPKKRLVNGRKIRSKHKFFLWMYRYRPYIHLFFVFVLT
jgi:hypothetical protein